MEADPEAGDNDDGDPSGLARLRRLGQELERASADAKHQARDGHGPAAS